MTDKSGPAAASRGTGRRLARIAGATAAVLVLATAGAGAWFYHRLDQNISTFSADGIATSRPPAGPTAAGGGRPVNILLLGSDTRSDGNGDLGGGDEGVGHSDTAILLHVYADHKHAVGVSIPRDTLVTVPPCKLPNGTWTSERLNQMFNSAFTVGLYPQGNPACTQNTVEALTGLRVDHTVVVDFKGFAAMTDAVHGVDVCVPNDVDSYGIHLTKGRRTLSGQQALDYVRARHGFGDGSDIGRMKRQQAFLSSLIKKIQGRGFDLTTLLPLADAATRSLTVDQELGSAMKLATFAQSLQDIKLADISFVTVPWEYAGARVALVHPDVDTLWELLRQDRTLDGRATAPATTAAPTAAPATTATPSVPAAPTPSPSPSSAVPGQTGAAGPDATAVPVTVHNASGATGTAGRAATALKAHGYREVVLGANTKGRTTTTVGYSSGHKAAAEQLAALYPGATVRPDADADGLVLTLGQDHASGDTSGPVVLPSGIPTGISSNTRPADSDLCADLSYG
ncbi:LCP family protein [Kitasatospora sp. DSM 101779]|uniref:LCP family protein n=1 Tax=Kitasatospora sp. DSM 101779 TaxID=2853165 RepID=UPI0021D83F9A|nr:LCP family protein [Kitasatospora sp. DSM 101779]MCU7824933.1 LCP family protein [Kitasatospora sp. DSM 101779]